MIKRKKRNNLALTARLLIEKFEPCFSKLAEACYTILSDPTDYQSTALLLEMPENQHEDRISETLAAVQAYSIRLRICDDVIYAFKTSLIQVTCPEEVVASVWECATNSFNEKITNLCDGNEFNNIDLGSEVIEQFLENPQAQRRIACEEEKYEKWFLKACKEIAAVFFERDIIEQAVAALPSVQESLAELHDGQIENGYQPTRPRPRAFLPKQSEQQVAPEPFVTLSIPSTDPGTHRASATSPYLSLGGGNWCGKSS